MKERFAMKQYRQFSHTLLATLVVFLGSFHASPPQQSPTDAVSLEKQVRFYSSQDRTSLKATLKESIDGAKRSVLLFSFTLSDTGIIDALNKKAQSGVPVTVVVDRDHLGPITEQKAPNIEVVTRKEGEGHLHHKLLIIDEKEVWIGSANFTTSAYENQENLMFRMVSPELAQFLHTEASAIRGDIKRTDHGPLRVDLLNQTIAFCLLPHDGPRHNAEEWINCASKQALIDKINNAKTSIKIAMNVWTSNDLTNAIILAHQRGVKVHVIAPDLFGSLPSLSAAGIPVTVYGRSALLHAKCMCIDDSIVVNGSANWSQSAFTRNDESFVIIESMTDEQAQAFADYWNYLGPQEPDKTTQELYKAIGLLKEELKDLRDYIKDLRNKLKPAAFK